jgi:hypothetical protein
MATFVSLNVDNSKDIIHVNMDKIVVMDRIGEKYTALRAADKTGFTVSQTPDQIMEMIRREQRVALGR